MVRGRRPQARLPGAPGAAASSAPDSAVWVSLNTKGEEGPFKVEQTGSTVPGR
jgi:hypothetical protein